MITDEERITRLYEEMYSAMINKDKAELERIHDDSFVLYHMTGMKQSKSEYISAIMSGIQVFMKDMAGNFCVWFKGTMSLL